MSVRIDQKLAKNKEKKVNNCMLEERKQKETNIEATMK